ncbi:hypothetical protein H5410_004091 [Solanum commersonii]|uniref:TF-B3 domain-containing protein n=1 Tax=Solanum commersonii TaxID=4109 RepID=A0A9J6B6N4_SOLCO|nr:hypothetical protein H5410_004091 [Solanum commersonii]
MKVNGHRFEAGSVEFVEQHGLKLGDILMFRHEENMEFEVSIFYSSHCDREYVEYLEEGGGGGGRDHTSEEISKKFNFKERPTRKIKPSIKASAHVNAATHHKSLDHSHFKCIIREYCFSRGYLKGDHIMFEVIATGETRIWKFQVTDREAPLQKFQGKFSHSDILSEDSHIGPQFEFGLRHNIMKKTLKHESSQCTSSYFNF